METVFDPPKAKTTTQGDKPAAPKVEKAKLAAKLKATPVAKSKAAPVAKPNTKKK